MHKNKNPALHQFYSLVSVLLGFHSSEVTFKCAAIICHHPHKILFIVKTVTENVQRYMQTYSALSNCNIIKPNCLPIDLDLIQTLKITDKLQVITPCPQWGDQNNNRLRLFFFWSTVYTYFFIFFALLSKLKSYGWQLSF